MISVRLWFLSFSLLLLCSSCGVLLTGSREPDSVRRLLVILDLEGQNYTLKGRIVLFNPDDEPEGVGFLPPGNEPPSGPIIAPGVKPLGLQSDPNGSGFYLGEPNRVLLYSINISALKPAEEPSFVKSEEVLVPPDTDGSACVLKNFRVTANATLLLGLVQCGSNTDSSRERVWVYSLSGRRTLGLVFNPDNTQFIRGAGIQEDDLEVLPGAFPYAASNNRLTFTTQVPGNSQQSRLYTLDLTRFPLVFPSGYQPKSTEAVYALDTEGGLITAATLNGVKRVNDLGELGDSLLSTGATRIWSTQGNALSAAAFWSDRDTFNNTRDLYFRTNVVNKLTNVPDMRDLVFAPSLGLSYHLEASNLVQTDLRDLSVTRAPRTFAQSYKSLSLNNPQALAWVIATR